jgi:hypothetical protein
MMKLARLLYTITAFLFASLVFAAVEEQETMPYLEFKKGCEVALSFMRNPDQPIKGEVDDFMTARESIGLIKGHFDAMRYLQSINPDIRVLDPRWKGKKTRDFVERVCEIMTAISAADPKLKTVPTVREVIVLAVRSQDGTPDLDAPR